MTVEERLQQEAELRALSRDDITKAASEQASHERDDGDSAAG